MGELESLRERVWELEARLEIDHRFVLKRGKMVRETIPAAERDSFPDGITCRDETIKLQDEELARLRADRDRLRAELRKIRAAYTRFKNRRSALSDPRANKVT